MSPEQFLDRLAKQPPAPVYLFIGPEPYHRELCRKALIQRALGPEDAAEGLTRHDLDETRLTAVLDDARSLSLFATKRLIWASSAEAVLPKRLTEKPDEGSDAAQLADYTHNAPPGVVLVLNCSRYDFEGDDRAKLDRVQKFYGAVPDQVEFRPHTPETARRLAQELARKSGLQLGVSELGYLCEALGGDVARIAQEIEKLSLFAGTNRKITLDDILQLAPNAQSTTIFGLVGAMGRGDRKKSLDALDLLLREGEYLPLVLTFLSTQFRLALVAQEADLKNAQQITSYFTKQGIRIWRDRAEQVQQTLTAFPKGRLKVAMEKLFEADRALRDTRPDDRLVMEDLVIALTR